MNSMLQFLYGISTILAKAREKDEKDILEFINISMGFQYERLFLNDVSKYPTKYANATMYVNACWQHVLICTALCLSLRPLVCLSVSVCLSLCLSVFLSLTLALSTDVKRHIQGIIQFYQSSLWIEQRRLGWNLPPWFMYPKPYQFVWIRQMLLDHIALVSFDYKRKSTQERHQNQYTLHLSWYGCLSYVPIALLFSHRSWKVTANQTINSR